METSAKLTPADLTWLVPALDSRLPQIIEEVREQFSAAWPDYAEFLEQEQHEVAAAGGAFLRRLIELVEHSDGTPFPDQDTPESALFEEIGRLQWREGRELTTLLSAYQVGARVAWHHVSREALELGVGPAALAALAEAVFIFIDQLSSASARGYVMEQTDAAAAREQLRNELVELLLSDRSDEVTVRAAASRAGWSLPRVAAVILVDPDNKIGQAVLARMDSSSLLIRRRTVIGAIVPDPVGPGRHRRLSDVLRGAGAVVGHPVALQHLPASMHIAEIAAGLQRDGILNDDPVFAAEHLDAIIVHRDARLLAAFRGQTLAPLTALPPSVRERLTETLAAWLRHFGDRHAVAAELHIHPQTVRYRMTQLHDLLGPTLDDPDGRARLMLALAWNRPVRAAGANGSGQRAASGNGSGQRGVAGNGSARRAASVDGSARRATAVDRPQRPALSG